MFEVLTLAVAVRYPDDAALGWSTHIGGPLFASDGAALTGAVDVDPMENAMSGSELLIETDPANWPAGWRDEWEFKEDSSPLPQAWHRCGLCFFFEFEQVDEKGNWAWVVMDDDVSLSRLEELRVELGDEAFFKFCIQLGREAKVRWRELGYIDWSLHKGAARQ